MRAIVLLIVISLIINAPNDPLTLLAKERKKKNQERMKKLKECISKDKASESFKQMINNNKTNTTLGKIIKLNREFISDEDMKIYNKCRKKIYLTYKKKIIKRP